MKKIILIGRSEAGKTTLKQVLRGEAVEYAKTQSINYYDIVVDTPGEYIQTRHLGGALAVYSYESDVIGLLASATEPFSLFGPAIAATATRPHRHRHQMRRAGRKGRDGIRLAQGSRL